MTQAPDGASGSALLTFSSLACGCAAWVYARRAPRLRTGMRPLAVTGAALHFQFKCNSRGRLVADREPWQLHLVDRPAKVRFLNSRDGGIDPKATFDLL